ncbi:MAG: PUA domain-containing protein [Sulfolobales archaeon]
MQLRYLSKRDVRELMATLRERYNLKSEYEKIAEVTLDIYPRKNNVKIYIAYSESNVIPLVLEIENLLIPSIHSLNLGILTTHYARVDSGAVPRILGGADVMAPGIIECSDFNKDDVVGVREPEKNLHILVGMALMSCSEIKNLRKGKAIKNIHYAGDKIWMSLIEVLRRLM